jgi:hypothetical protein
MMNDQKILDNAPEGATHIDTELKYWDIRACNDHPLVWSNGKWFVTDDIPTAFSLLRPLADIKELVELRSANAELEKELKVTPKLQGVLDFLLGIGDIEGYDFSEGPEDQGPYWWRAHLREALKAGN